MGLPGAAQARKLSFPLLGMEVTVPDSYTIEHAGPSRVSLKRTDSPIRLALYHVEFGNLEKLTATHEQQLLHELRQRLGAGGRAQLAPLRLAGRPGQKVVMIGRRGGGVWEMTSGWSFRGGQASVVEVLYPVQQRTEGQQLFGTLCRSLVWLSLERG